ncbi:helicase required for RNAi-mediated heterochromatin assembly 1 [Colletotrichum karsti]|uniref:Helicase required for RNAi-mediated heterochromatin assembly 1 n=1 Tax=Colletotrichum karsti TaxID=1095194 RepID=A0A9P6I0W0_9PEZI|nr:helicase required for RNAi-mediated heterochromatin assembly 1 [Colletotrichum karsti]KAF9869830.1 helicase required for RNAi-mediated heterochromatin assembly 1 [Colletotrichum karsti]
MTASQAHQPDPRRASRLLKVFGDVTKGGRVLATAADARLFLEAVRMNASPAACLEIITARDVAQNALRHSLRVDSSVSFINYHVIPFIAYMSDPGVKLMYNGQLLRQVLLLVVQPPILWGNLFNAYKESQLSGENLHIFAWLCLELASLPGEDYNDIISDITSALQLKPFREAQDHKTRDLLYRIKKVLALRATTSPDDDPETAGGRHDNDFANFREISIFPTSDEFYSGAQPFYRRASEVAAANSSERPRIHLDNQFRLLREDMLGELRDDLKVAIGRKRGKKNSQILGGLLPIGIDTGDEKRGRRCAVLLSCRAMPGTFKSLNLAKRKKFLENNKAFLRHQSFGALCGDDHIIAFAFVFRDVDQLMKSPPVIVLQFTSSDATARALDALQSPANLRFVLVHTPVFAYQPVLECLQEITEMPLEGGLLRLDTNSDDSSCSPPILSASVQACVRQLEDLLAGGGRTQYRPQRRWFGLGSRHFVLDESQNKAVLHALNSAVALIQGPPGKEIFPQLLLASQRPPLSYSMPTTAEEVI